MGGGRLAQVSRGISRCGRFIPTAPSYFVGVLVDQRIPRANGEGWARFRRPKHCNTGEKYQQTTAKKARLSTVSTGICRTHFRAPLSAMSPPGQWPPTLFHARGRPGRASPAEFFCAPYPGGPDRSTALFCESNAHRKTDKPVSCLYLDAIEQSQKRPTLFHSALAVFAKPQVYSAPRPP